MNTLKILFAAMLLSALIGCNSMPTKAQLQGVLDDARDDVAKVEAKVAVMLNKAHRAVDDAQEDLDALSE